MLRDGKEHSLRDNPKNKAIRKKDLKLFSVTDRTKESKIVNLMWNEWWIHVFPKY